MVNVVAKRCGYPGCVTHPSNGTAGGKKAEFFFEIFLILWGRDGQGHRDALDIEFRLSG